MCCLTWQFYCCTQMKGEKNRLCRPHRFEFSTLDRRRLLHLPLGVGWLCKGKIFKKKHLWASKACIPNSVQEIWHANHSLHRDLLKLVLMVFQICGPFLYLLVIHFILGVFWFLKLWHFLSAGTLWMLSPLSPIGWGKSTRVNLQRSMGSQNMTTFKRETPTIQGDLHKLQKPAKKLSEKLETLNISCEFSIFLEIFFWWMFDHVKYPLSSWPHHTLRKDSHLQSLHISWSYGLRFKGKPSDTNVTGCDDGPKPFITPLDIRIHSDRAENSRCSKSLVHGIKVEMPHQTACHRTQTNLLAATSMRYISLPLIEFLRRIIADHFQFHFLTVSLTGFGIYPVK